MRWPSVCPFRICCGWRQPPNEWISKFIDRACLAKDLVARVKATVYSCTILTFPTIVHTAEHGFVTTVVGNDPLNVTLKNEKKP
jgi:hypothetical protein